MDYFKKFVRTNDVVTINGVCGMFDGDTFTSVDGGTTFASSMVDAACNSVMSSVQQDSMIRLLRSVLKKGSANYLVEGINIDIIDTAHVMYVRFLSRYEILAYQGFVFLKELDNVMCYGDQTTCEYFLVCLYLWLYEVQGVTLTTNWDILLYGHREFIVHTPYTRHMVLPAIDLGIRFSGISEYGCKDFITYVLKLYMQMTANQECMVSYDTRLRTLEKVILQNNKHVLQYPGYGVLPRWLTFEHSADCCGRYCRITTSSGRLLLVTTTYNCTGAYTVWTAEGVSVFDAIYAITVDVSEE